MTHFWKTVGLTHYIHVPCIPAHSGPTVRYPFVISSHCSHIVIYRHAEREEKLKEAAELKGRPNFQRRQSNFGLRDGRSAVTPSQMAQLTQNIFETEVRHPVRAPKSCGHVNFSLHFCIFLET
jgi:hypothetical protein